MKRSLIPSVIAACFALGPMAAMAFCDAPGSWMVRVGGHNIDPTGDSTLNDGVTKVDVSSKFGPTFNLDYKFCRNFTVDLLAALPYTHDISLNGTKVGTTQHLPPVLSLQYHPLADSAFDPFFGVGVNYTMFFNTSLSGAPGALDLKNSLGYALQAGLDYRFKGTPWRVGADVRYIDIEPKAYLYGQEIGTVKIDPLAYGITVGYAF